MKREISVRPLYHLLIDVYTFVNHHYLRPLFFFRLLHSSPETDHFLPIHREAPAFVEQATEQQILVTGIKVHTIFINRAYIFIKPHK